MKAKPSSIPVYWKKHLQAWNKTSLSQAHYCQEYQLKVHQFGYYKRRQAELTRQQPLQETGFVQLTSNPTKVIKGSSLRLHYSKKQFIDGITSETLHLVRPLLDLLV